MRRIIMHAAITTLSVQPDKMDEMIELAQKILPMNLPGLQNVYLLANREKNEVMTLAVYDTEADAMALNTSGVQSGQQELIQKMGQLVKMQGARDLYEVVVNV
jgi:heme-degrading monooxygenase HmoA